MCILLPFLGDTKGRPVRSYVALLLLGFCLGLTQSTRNANGDRTRELRRRRCCLRIPCRYTLCQKLTWLQHQRISTFRVLTLNAVWIKFIPSHHPQFVVATIVYLFQPPHWFTREAMATFPRSTLIQFQIDTISRTDPTQTVYIFSISRECIVVELRSLKPSTVKNCIRRTLITLTH